VLGRYALFLYERAVGQRGHIPYLVFEKRTVGGGDKNEVLDNSCFNKGKRSSFVTTEKCYQDRDRFKSFYKRKGTFLNLSFINPLALELDIYSLAHHLCTM